MTSDETWDGRDVGRDVGCEMLGDVRGERRDWIRNERCRLQLCALCYVGLVDEGEERNHAGYVVS